MKKIGVQQLQGILETVALYQAVQFRKKGLLLFGPTLFQKTARARGYHSFH